MIFYSKSFGGFFASEMLKDGFPDDSIEISEEEHQALLTGQTEGQIIVADTSGRPILADPPIPAVMDRRSVAKRGIDTEAGNARSRFVSAGQLVAEEYMQAESAANQWTDAGRPSDEVPADVQVWADAAGMTPDQAANDILATAQNWRGVITTIRQIRLAGKAAVDAATDLGTADDMATAAQPYIDQLEALKP